VLVRGVVGADLRVEGTRVELGTHPVVGSIDGPTAASLGAAPGEAGRSSGGSNSAGRDNGTSRWGGVNTVGRNGSVSGIVSVGTGHNNLEVLAVATVVGGGRSVKVRAPQSALVVGDGRGVGAVVTPDSRSGRVVFGRVLTRVTLDVDVERSAEVGTVAVGGTVRNVVRGQGIETEVRVGARRSIQVLESLEVGVARSGGRVKANDDSRSSRSHAVEGRVGKEGRGSVRSNLGAISVRLRSTRVLRVDETTVGALLGGSRAGSGRRAGARDSVDSGRARRGRAGAGRGGNSLEAGRRKSLGAASVGRLDSTGGGGSGGRAATTPSEQEAVEPAQEITLLDAALIDNVGRRGRDGSSSGTDSSRDRLGNSRAADGDSLVGDTVQDGSSLDSRSSSQLVKVKLLGSGRSSCQTGEGGDREETCGSAHVDQFVRKVLIERLVKYFFVESVLGESGAQGECRRWEND